METKKLMWEPLVSAAAIIITIIGVLVPVFLHQDGKMDKTLTAMHEEMKEFHGRLIAIETRRRSSNYSR